MTDLAPLRLPRRIEVKTTQCGQTNSWYDSTDGSVTIYIQRDSPGADKESNWLPRFAPFR